MRPTFTQESDFRQQRDFGQKFTATFEFIGAHWQGLGSALAYIVLPAAIGSGIMNGLVQLNMQNQLRAAGSAGAGMAARIGALGSLTQSPFYWLNIVVSIVFLTLLALTVYGYMRLCLRPTPSPEPITASAVWAEVRTHFVGAFFSYFTLAIITGIGFLFLVIPGIYLAVAFSLFFVVKVVENTGFSDTASRCLRLTRGKWWSTFGLVFVMLLMLGLVLTVVGGFVGGIVGGIAGGLGLYKPGMASSGIELFTVIVSSLSGLFNLLIYPPLLIALGFQYFNLVERRDGVGLRNLVSQLGQAPVAVAETTYRPDDEGEY